MPFKNVDEVYLTRVIETIFAPRASHLGLLTSSEDEDLEKADRLHRGGRSTERESRETVGNDVLIADHPHTGGGLDCIIGRFRADLKDRRRVTQLPPCLLKPLSAPQFPE